MAPASSMLTTDNPVFAAYLFYCSVLVVKVLSMAALTARQRFGKQVFANPEDSSLTPKGKVKYDDPDVERVRRAHLNDLENIPFFILSAFAYTMTNPTPWLAVNLFRAFTIARIVHTFVYAVFVVPQPARAIAFFVGIGVTMYMSLVSIAYFSFAA
ncbi:hypothetical protein AAG570_013536 [Ranatra chinensis]|uniref:Microsomal glutathione S-transferase 1 n=1 Tax=Ranatra chinensis TaxID=642074 RepID=A0ABD0YED2_9HEMI